MFIKISKFNKLIRKSLVPRLMPRLLVMERHLMMLNWMMMPPLRSGVPTITRRTSRNALGYELDEYRRADK
jgi:hypothetical protein